MVGRLCLPLSHSGGSGGQSLLLRSNFLLESYGISFHIPHSLGREGRRTRSIPRFLQCLYFSSQHAAAMHRRDKTALRHNQRLTWPDAASIKIWSESCQRDTPKALFFTSSQHAVGKQPCNQLEKKSAPCANTAKQGETP
jgi:hypothetical protein